jgi:2'-5' RNA ligase
MGCCNGGGTLVNSFALVSYLPEPLAGFLDRLRNDLVQECHARAHVTVLPPRPLAAPSGEAWQDLKDRLQDFQPFRVELGPIEVFPVTDVLYFSVQAGQAELKRLHQALNVGRLAFEEPFVYHPHVTLAQDLDQNDVAATVEIAARRWQEFLHSRSFVVDALTFVQNTLENRWTDLHGIALSHSVPSL